MAKDGERGDKCVSLLFYVGGFTEKVTGWSDGRCLRRAGCVCSEGVPCRLGSERGNSLGMQGLQKRDIPSATPCLGLPAPALF